MKLAIISDSHDNLENVKKFLLFVEEIKVEKIICLGDVAKIETLNYLATKFLGEIFLVRGNADLYSPADLKKHKNIKYLQELGEIEIGGLKLALVHEPEKIKHFNLLDQESTRINIVKQNLINKIDLKNSNSDKLKSSKQSLNELNQNKVLPDFIFYGHAHKPWLKKEGKTFVANPGTLGGVYYQATFAILNTETKNLELRGLN